VVSHQRLQLGPQTNNFDNVRRAGSPHQVTDITGNSFLADDGAVLARLRPRRDDSTGYQGNKPAAHW